MSQSFSHMLPLIVVGAVVVGFMLIKKLVKVAVIVGVLVFVVLPYLNSNGALDGIKSALGL